jgi:3-phenylpropionate/cinnamic acid dioxygenase small subunit
MRAEMSEYVSLEMFHAIEQFYYREARLFAEKRYREWLDTMVDNNIHYWLPIFEERYRADRKQPPQFPPAIYDDNYADLDERIKRLETNLVWMEDPPSRIRHVISNVEAYHGDNEGEFVVYSNFLVCRNRREREQTMMVGAREDRLRQADSSFKLARRKIMLQQRVIQDTNLYYFM